MMEVAIMIKELAKEVVSANADIDTGGYGRIWYNADTFLKL